MSGVGCLKAEGRNAPMERARDGALLHAELVELGGLLLSVIQEHLSTFNLICVQFGGAEC